MNYLKLQNALLALVLDENLNYKILSAISRLGQLEDKLCLMLCGGS